MSARRDTFKTKSTLELDGKAIAYHRLAALGETGVGHVERLPYSLKVLLENLLRSEDGRSVTAEHIRALAAWDPAMPPDREIAFRPARVLLQDFTGVPAVVDLAAMRDAMADMGGDPQRINPLQDVELVIDHSVQVDAYGNEAAFRKNADLEFDRNGERYALLKWGQQALHRFRALPPDTGIVHQVNLEYLARVVFAHDVDGQRTAYPDTVVGTDSHTTMVNGLGVLGWGVGGIEAEAAMLGQPISMLIPEVVGFRLLGARPEGVTATDLVLKVTEMLRRKGVVGKFVEFFGSGLSDLSVADRATIGNMSPEYGSTCAIFPIDEQTLGYLRLTGRSSEQISLVREYAQAQGMFRRDDSAEPLFSDVLELDLGDVEPSLAGPRRPQDRVPLRKAKESFDKALLALEESRGPEKVPAGRVADWAAEGGNVATEARARRTARYEVDEQCVEIHDGSVVIAAITSCTNTSNPSVMVAAGLLAKAAVERGLRSKPWVKTSLAPGSKVVTDYLDRAGLTTYLEQLGFYLVGYGCTTCIGNSGPLADPIAAAISDNDLVVCAVLSGNRNFEGRIHPLVRANYLASPPLVVAYALAGTMDFDPLADPLGLDPSGAAVYLRDLWPSSRAIADVVAECVAEAMFRRRYADAFGGDERWRNLRVPTGDRYAWSPESTYVKKPPFFDGMKRQPQPLRDIERARVLALLGDSVTTDHISPAGSIGKNSPAGQYLTDRGIEPIDFNSYGSRRGNHEVMARGTFANVRLRNTLAPGTEGGFTRHLPDGEVTSIFDAATRYADEGVPLIIIAGKEYGSGSSRDWAAKGPRLLGVRAVIAESFERIHRSNLIGMGVLPLQFDAGQSSATLGLTGEESFDISGLAQGVRPGARIVVAARSADGAVKSFAALVRIDTPDEAEYYRHDGILPYVLRQLHGS
ncbi:MAG: aconitate hydratase AcnA [Candidatus Eremiobacteraeota bacterium]|nr:aconitate hydratase AcnA [Candidatus Eremiobacteraeota bacterium]MBC5827381.1 aconitate hydratase AcnA [Candidatus Eremiobacteraeota bacterium]